MGRNLDQLLDEKGEAAGGDLVEALFQDNIDRITDAVLSRVRQRMASDPETSHLAQHLDLREDSELNENAHIIYSLSYRPLRNRIERFMAHVTEQTLENQLRFAKADTRAKLNALVREDIEDLDF